MVPLKFLLFLPLVLSEYITPSVKPRVLVNAKNQISYFVKDEPGVTEVYTTSIFDGVKQLYRANYDTVTREWWCTTKQYGFNNVTKIDYIIIYIFPNTVQKTYEGTIYINKGTGLQPSPLQISRRSTVVLFDEFNGNSLDMSKWQYEVTAWGGGNGEFQMYTPEASNTFVHNGILHLKPTFTADRFGENFLHNGHLDVKGQWGVCTRVWDSGCHRNGSQNNIPPIMSSKIKSKVTIRYGRIEVFAKIPKGDWIWPAIWLLPPGGRGKYGGWPRSGEIDIMEARGNANLRDGSGEIKGCEQVLSTIHLGSGGGGGHRRHSNRRIAPNGKTWGDDYHMYSLDWTADHIRMDVDDQPILAWNTPSEGYWKHEGLHGNNIWSSGGKDAPFDGQLGLILNVAVGGRFFQDGWNNGPDGKPWSSGSHTAAMDFWKNRQKWQHTWHSYDVSMKIKSVKMIQY